MKIANLVNVNKLLLTIVIAIIYFFLFNKTFEYKDLHNYAAQALRLESIGLKDHFSEKSIFEIFAGEPLWQLLMILVGNLNFNPYDSLRVLSFLFISLIIYGFLCERSYIGLLIILSFPLFIKFSFSQLRSELAVIILLFSTKKILNNYRFSIFITLFVHISSAIFLCLYEFINLISSIKRKYRYLFFSFLISMLYLLLLFFYSLDVLSIIDKKFNTNDYEFAIKISLLVSIYLLVLCLDNRFLMDNDFFCRDKLILVFALLLVLAPFYGLDITRFFIYFLVLLLSRSASLGSMKKIVHTYTITLSLIFWLLFVN